jgi:hypothetical protein
MATVNEGDGGNNSNFIKARNSITVPLHTTMQVQSSVCTVIIFAISVVLTSVLMKIQVFW